MSDEKRHDCYPTNERWPRCVTCGRDMDPAPGGDADRAWFAEQRRRVAENKKRAGR